MDKAAAKSSMDITEGFWCESASEYRAFRRSGRIEPVRRNRESTNAEIKLLAESLYKTRCPSEAFVSKTIGTLIAKENSEQEGYRE